MLPHMEVWGGGSGLAMFSVVSVTQAPSILSLYCIWLPRRDPKDSICPKKTERARNRKERERGQRNHNISAYIPLAFTKLLSHTQLQRTLGNVVLVLAAMFPAENPITMKDGRNRSPAVSGSLCHSVWAILQNRITETVRHRLNALEITMG